MFAGVSSVRPLVPIVLPPKGGTFVDPSFGTTILRVTDASDGGPSFHAYSYISAFNADSTRFLINKGGVPTLFALEASNVAVLITARPDGRVRETQ